MAVHPYYPVGVSIPEYVPNELSTISLLFIIGGACSSILAVVWMIVRTRRPELPISDMLTILWFTLCASLHLGFESYLVRHWNDIAAQQSILGQLWKEYSLSDSRYLTQDPEVLCLEIITVLFWGPLSLITAIIIFNSHPMRHGLQIIISMAHLYGVVMYYTTSLFKLWFNGLSDSRPEPLYFWVYFIGLNAPWFFVPLALIWSSLTHIAGVIAMASMSKTKSA